VNAPGWAYLWRRAWRIARRRLQVRPRWRLPAAEAYRVLAMGAGVLAAHFAGVATVWLAVAVAGLLAARSMMLAQTNATLDARLNSVEKTHADLSAHVTTVAASAASTAGVLTTAQANITSLFTDFSSVSGLAGNAAFLANLSKLPNQTTSNATTFSNANFTGLANAVNNLQQNLQSNGFEH
jgi:hypothetical protein